jgi:hypothetical protein
MKSNKIEVAHWLPREDDGSGNIYIDWPVVQKEAGQDHLEWLLKQDKDRCQLVVEHRANSTHHYLIAEFYDNRLITEYFLLWAK